MKKITIILAILLMGCNTEDEVCTCTGKFSQNTPDGTYFYIQNTKIDCGTNQLIEKPTSNPNAIFWGCKQEG